jgi:hypothetical protein
MKSVRFSKVVEESGKPEVYLLMSETDSDFHKALEAGKIMSLSGESHRSGPEYGTVGYDKARYGQLLLFPKSLKSFTDAKIIGIKYDLFAQDGGSDENEASPRLKEEKKVTKKRSDSPLPKKSVRKTPAKEKKAAPKPAAKKVIPFPAKEDEHDEEGGVLTCVDQAMRALEKGDSVGAYNILKQIVGGP